MTRIKVLHQKMKTNTIFKHPHLIDYQFYIRKTESRG